MAFAVNHAQAAFALAQTGGELLVGFVAVEAVEVGFALDGLYKNKSGLCVARHKNVATQDLTPS